MNLHLLSETFNQLLYARQPQANFTCTQALRYSRNYCHQLLQGKYHLSMTMRHVYGIRKSGLKLAIFLILYISIVPKDSLLYIKLIFS